MSRPSSSHGDRNVLRSVNIEGLQRAEVRRGFDQDAVSTVDEEFSDQVERLLRAGSDEDIFGAGDDAIAGEIVGNHFPQRLVAFGGAVLQGLGALFAENFVAGFLESLYGKDIGRRQSAGERNDFRFLRDL